MTGNADESVFWSGPAGAQWIEHEAEQDHFLSAVATAIIERADLSPDDRVLDIGCGTGAVSLLAAPLVGPGGHILAIDIAAPFVARVKTRARDLPQISALHADAQTANWPPPAFDVAVSRFGVMFFADPAAAFANIAQALRPGGSMVFAAWGRTEDNPYWQVSRDVIDRMLGPRPRPAPNAPGPMGLADADWTLDRLKAAGLTDIAVETTELRLLHEGGAEGAADLSLRIGPAVRPMAEADATPEMLSEYKAQATRAFQPFETGGQARIPATIHIYTARRD